MEYKIVNQAHVSVISLQGDITYEDKDIIKACHQELIGLKSRKVILLFKNVSSVARGVFRELTMLQCDARKKHMKLHLVGLNSSLKSSLSEGGVIRLEEIKNTLDDALAP